MCAQRVATGLPAMARKPVRKSRSAFRGREAFWGILFASPFLLGIILWTVAPVLASLGMSFTSYTGMEQPAWLGLDNYTRAFAADTKFWPSWERTIKYALVSLPLSIIAPLSLALLIDQKSWGSNFFRAVYYAPSLTPVVALTTLFGWVFSQKLGLLNALLRVVLGIEGPAWLGDPQWVIPGIIMISLWAGSGGNGMLIFLAALQGVSPELYEAAQIDGASWWRRFLNVTLPMISPIVFLMLVMNTIGFLKAFDMVFNATAGGPAYATYFIALHIYSTAFRYFEMGYASALSWLLLVFTMVLTLIQFQVQKRWVYYSGDGGA